MMEEQVQRYISALEGTDSKASSPSAVGASFTTTGLNLDVFDEHALHGAIASLDAFKANAASWQPGLYRITESLARNKKRYEVAERMVERAELELAMASSTGKYTAKYQEKVTEAKATLALVHARWLARAKELQAFQASIQQESLLLTPTEWETLRGSEEGALASLKRGWLHAKLFFMRSTGLVSVGVSLFAFVAVLLSTSLRHWVGMGFAALFATYFLWTVGVQLYTMWQQRGDKKGFAISALKLVSVIMFVALLFEILPVYGGVSLFGFLKGSLLEMLPAVVRELAGLSATLLADSSRIGHFFGIPMTFLVPLLNPIAAPFAIIAMVGMYFGLKAAYQKLQSTWPSLKSVSFAWPVFVMLGLVLPGIALGIAHIPGVHGLTIGGRIAGTTVTIGLPIFSVVVVSLLAAIALYGLYQMYSSYKETRHVDITALKNVQASMDELRKEMEALEANPENVALNAGVPGNKKDFQLFATEKLTEFREQFVQYESAAQQVREDMDGLGPLTTGQTTALNEFQKRVDAYTLQYGRTFDAVKNFNYQHSGALKLDEETFGALPESGMKFSTPVATPAAGASGGPATATAASELARLEASVSLDTEAAARSFNLHRSSFVESGNAKDLQKMRAWKAYVDRSYKKLWDEGAQILLYYGIINNMNEFKPSDAQFCTKVAEAIEDQDVARDFFAKLGESYKLTQTFKTQLQAAEEFLEDDEEDGDDEDNDNDKANDKKHDDDTDDDDEDNDDDEEDDDDEDNDNDKANDEKPDAVVVPSIVDKNGGASPNNQGSQQSVVAAAVKPKADNAGQNKQGAVKKPDAVAAPVTVDKEGGSTRHHNSVKDEKEASPNNKGPQQPAVAAAAKPNADNAGQNKQGAAAGGGVGTRVMKEGESGEVSVELRAHLQSLQRKVDEAMIEFTSLAGSYSAKTPCADTDKVGLRRITKLKHELDEIKKELYAGSKRILVTHELIAADADFDAQYSNDAFRQQVNAAEFFRESGTMLASVGSWQQSLQGMITHQPANAQPVADGVAVREKAASAAAKPAAVKEADKQPVAAVVAPPQEASNGVSGGGKGGKLEQGSNATKVVAEEKLRQDGDKLSDAGVGGAGGGEAARNKAVPAAADVPKRENESRKVDPQVGAELQGLLKGLEEKFYDAVREFNRCHNAYLVNGDNKEFNFRQLQAAFPKVEEIRDELRAGSRAILTKYHLVKEDNFDTNYCNLEFRRLVDAGRFFAASDRMDKDFDALKVKLQNATEMYNTPPRQQAASNGDAREGKQLQEENAGGKGLGATVGGGANTSGMVNALNANSVSPAVAADSPQQLNKASVPVQGSSNGQGQKKGAMANDGIGSNSGADYGRRMRQREQYHAQASRSHNPPGNSSNKSGGQSSERRPQTFVANAQGGQQGRRGVMENGTP